MGKKLKLTLGGLVKMKVSINVSIIRGIIK